MHVVKVEIENVKCIEHLVWEIEPARAAGWHVLLGDNGSGKTTVLQTVAELNAGWGAYMFASAWPWDVVRKGRPTARARVAWSRHPGWDDLRDGEPDLPFCDEVLKWAAEANGLHGVTAESGALRSSPDGRSVEPFSLAAGERPGWFSAGYGPVRRYWGEDVEPAARSARVDRHGSLFSVDFALNKIRPWLVSQYVKQLEGNSWRMARVVALVNAKGFLPRGMTFKGLTSDGIFFVDSLGAEVALNELSAGCTSLLCLLFDLLLQLDDCFGFERIFDKVDPTRVVAPGVVLIDEIDAHLHPTWQASVGTWFCRHFPNMQFIVATHSPLVCQSVTEESGSIWLLPDPASLEPGDNAIRRAEGSTFRRLIYGNILDAYGTGYFGEIGRSEEANRRLDRLATLNVKELRQPLSKREKAEQQKLRAETPTDAYNLA